jgi:hypothetical protein
MQLLRKKQTRFVCAKTDRSPEHKRRHRWLTWIFPIGGLLALIWFLIRVIPKPSRAMYPCQRVAFPLASGFVIWLTATIGSIAAIRKARRTFAKSRYVLCVILVAVSVGSVWLALSITTEKTVLADEPVANAPIGTAKGIFPGRVVWVHDPDATDWQTDYTFSRFGPGRDAHVYDRTGRCYLAGDGREDNGGL